MDSMQKHPNFGLMTTVLSHDPWLECSSLSENSYPRRARCEPHPNPQHCQPSWLCNCYNRSNSIYSFCLISWLIVATKHCRATLWSPLTTTFPYLLGNFTFRYSMDPWSHHDRRVWRESMNHYEIHHHFLSFFYHRELDLPASITIFLLNPTNGVSYLVRFLSFKSNPFMQIEIRNLYLLPRSTITLLMINPLNRRVTTNASPCVLVFRPLKTQLD